MGSLTTDTLTEAVLREHLTTEKIGKLVHYFPSLDSTNIVCKELAEKGEPHGTLVLADTQTRGRGRLGRTWFSPSGGLWFSLILRPNEMRVSPAHLTFLAGLALAQACSKNGVNVSLRWPNDLFIGNKKVGGILTESKGNGSNFDYFILGVGLNINLEESVFPTQLKDEATSLLIEKKELILRAPFLAYTLFLFEKLLTSIYPKQGFAPILKLWKKYATFLGTPVRVDTSTESIEGEAVDVTLTGALAVQDIDGIIHEISCGDVRKLW